MFNDSLLQQLVQLVSSIIITSVLHVLQDARLVPQHLAVSHATVLISLTQTENVHVKLVSSIQMVKTVQSVKSETTTTTHKKNALVVELTVTVAFLQPSVQPAQQFIQTKLVNAAVNFHLNFVIISANVLMIKSNLVCFV